MTELLILLRAASLFTHNAHHHVSKVVFLQDHEFFGGLYPMFADAYDSVAERSIGKFGEDTVDLMPILQGVMERLSDAPSLNVAQNSQFYKYQLELEKDICAIIQHYIGTGKLTEGTRQMLGDLADSSEGRQYLIQQRIK